MTRRLSAVAVAAALVLSFAACSKKEEAGTTGATTASSTSTTAQSTGTTEKASSDTTERKSTGTTQKKTTGTTTKSGSTRSMKTDKFQLTATEEECVNDGIVAAGLEDPSLATNDARAAGAVGQIFVNCIPKPRLATGLTEEIKNNPLTANLSSTQEQCIRDTILAADGDQLAIFIGYLVYSSQSGDAAFAETYVKPIEDDINNACGTNISLDL